MKNYFIDDIIRDIVKQENEVLYQRMINELRNLVHKNESKKILNLKEACAFLTCSESYLYKMTSTNQIPHSKRGKKLFFDKNELIEWLLKNKVNTRDEISNKIDKLLAS